MAMVAHPDDCVIFAYSFMHHYRHLDWTVCYLTYTEQTARGKEFSNFWSRRNVKTKFLGYVDNWHDIENKKISFDEESASTNIQLAMADQDVILTHDHNGDYGHLHHKFVCNAVCNHHSYVVTFAGVNQGNVKYSIDPGFYSLDEFPLHKDIVSGFHQHMHANEYCVSERVKKIL